MWINDYQKVNYNQSFDVPDGEHKVVITKAEIKTSKTNKKMIEVTANVQDSNGVPFVDRIVEGEYFDINMSRFFDAYGIQAGNFDFRQWCGKSACAIFTHKNETFTDQYGISRTVSKANLIKYIISENARISANNYVQQQNITGQNNTVNRGWGQIGNQPNDILIY